MTVVQETVVLDVEQNTRAAGKAVVKFVADCKAALKLGSPLPEALAVASAALSDLLPILAAVPTAIAEAKENTVAEVDTVFLFGRDLLKAVQG